MLTRRSSRALGACAILSCLFFTGCSQDGGPAGQTAPHPDAEAINGYVDGLPDYELRVQTAAAPVDLGTTFAVLVEDGWELDYRCQAQEEELVLETNEIMSPDQNFGVLWPGAIIQGNSVESGELKPLLLDRAPLTMTINVDAPVTSIVVDVPNSVNAQQAVSDLKRSVDPNLNGDNAPSTPGTIDYISEAANSFQQSMVSMGVTAGYSAPMAPALGGSASMSLTRSYSEQTIIVRLIQKLFTIEIADDLPALREPAGFFALSVSAEDIMAAEQDGQIGPENLPMYVKSVTYGRIIIFTLSSTTATSASSLEAAVQGSYDDFQGGGSGGTGNWEELSSYTVKVYSAGGDPTVAEAAVNDLEFGQFFTDIPATAAVPLSYKLKTLKGGATSDFVRIAEKATFEERLEDCDRPTGYEVTTELVRVKLTDTGTLPCACGWLSQTGFFSLFKLGQGIFVGFAPQTKEVGKMEVASFQEPERDALLRTGFDLWSSWLEGLGITNTPYDYPFNTIDIEDGRDETHTLSALGATAKFKYRLTKKPIY